MKEGKLVRIAGPVATAELSARMFDIVLVGEEKLLGEVIQINENKCTIQIYEDTSGLKPGNPVMNTGEPLSVELGPGLLTSIYDGIQRPLPLLQSQLGDFIKRGATAPGLDHEKEWKFEAKANKGEQAGPGQIIGEVLEHQTSHKIMVPPGMTGRIEEISSGTFKIDDPVCRLQNGQEIRLMQKWPVRIPRPAGNKLLPTIPLVTGQRIFDSLFPLAKGGVAAIPGGFGTGKTVTQQSLAKWSDADIIVYVGCGERGNEMTEVLTEFPHLQDPFSGKPLLNRTILIANTSNMPVAAREASIYCGMTLAEYYRDMGYNVAMMADSTSRWAEAMREISSRLEELPGEEGYPAYLSSRLSDFYERAGRYSNLNGTEGSVSVIGAVSPPGGDFSEPVTQGTLRVVKTFWALDTKLSQRRHFPAINWLTSYSLYLDALEPWFSKNVAEDWRDAVDRTMSILQEEEKLLELVQLVGSDSLSEKEQTTLQVARLIREVVLQQNAFHDVDTYSAPLKTYNLMKAILKFGNMAQEALSGGVKVADIVSMKSKDKLGEVKFEKDYGKALDSNMKNIEKEFQELRKKVLK